MKIDNLLPDYDITAAGKIKYPDDDLFVRCCFCGELTDSEFSYSPAPLAGEDQKCCVQCFTKIVIPARERESAGQSKAGGKGAVEALLRHGEENALSADYIMGQLGVPSRRVLRAMIEKERKSGSPIIAAKKGGYYLPSSGRKGIIEVKQFATQLRHNGLSNLALATIIEECYKQKSSAAIKAGDNAEKEDRV